MRDDMQSDRELDRIIDAALTGYSLAEPRPGLELRILARVRTERPRPSRLLWWLAAVPAIACLLLVFLKAPNKPRRNPVAVAVGTPTAVPLASASQPSAIQPERLVAERPRRPSGVASALPKLDLFPSPSPLTAEERALLALSQAPVPIPGRPETAELHIAPIRIAELQIEPVTVPPLVSTVDPAQSTQHNQRKTQP